MFESLQCTLSPYLLFLRLPWGAQSVPKMRRVADLNNTEREDNRHISGLG